MDRNRLHQLMQDPERVSAADLAALRSLAQRYPWFSGARLLLAVGEQRNGDMLGQQDPGNTAAFIPSRSVLHDLLYPHGPGTPLQVVKDDGPVETTPGSATADTIKVEDPLLHTEDAAEGPSVSAVEEVAQAAPEAGDAQRIPPTVPPAEDALPSPAAPPTEQLPVEPTGQQDPPSAQTAPPPPAHAEGGSDGEDPASDTNQLEQMYQEAILASQYAVAAPPLGEATPPVPGPAREVAPPPGTDPEASPSAGASSSLRSFTAWLQQAPTSPAPPPPPAPLPSPAVAPQQPPTVGPASGPQSDLKAIVDRFIDRSTPAPAAQRASFFNPQKAAKRSLEDEGMVSETLARIHEVQGNFAKAKEIYDRLAAADPRKSVYFAALSKAVEARMKQSP